MKSVKQLLAAHERLPSRAHQLVGVERLVERPFFALFDEVGAGKTKQVIDAAQILFTRGEIDTALVIAPGFARSTWADEDPTLGEIAKHAWDAVPNVIHEFRPDYTDIRWEPGLNWVVSNYELIRRDARLAELLRTLRGRRTWLICDESWNVKGFSDQTRACFRLRYRRAERVTLLNGTPLDNGKPEDIYYQFMLLDKGILGVTTRAHFRQRYCVMGGFQNRQVIDYQNLDELNARVAPHVLARKTRDCFDLPPMLDPIVLEAPLTDASWKIYRQMRDDLVAWLGTQASVSRQAVVRGLRLAQICSGFLGGLEDEDSEHELGANTPDLGTMPDWLRIKRENQRLGTAPSAASAACNMPQAGPSTKEIGREKLDALLRWLKQNPTDKLIVWSRFRPELERNAKELARLFPRVERLCGGVDKEPAKRLLAPDGDRSPGVVCGIQKAGGASLNFSAASVAVYMSNGVRLLEKTQSIGRIERPGQRSPMLVVDIIATGPKGQKTFDHQLLKSLRNKDDMARWSVAQWRAALAEE
jgi:hypothetical protein